MQVARYWRNRKLRYQLDRRLLRPERDQQAEAQLVEATTELKRRVSEPAKVMLA